MLFFCDKCQRVHMWCTLFNDKRVSDDVNGVHIVDNFPGLRRVQVGQKVVIVKGILDGMLRAVKERKKEEKCQVTV